MEKLLTPKEAARILNIGEATFKRLACQVKIPSIRLGPRTLRFDPEALDL